MPDILLDLGLIEAVCWLFRAASHLTFVLSCCIMSPLMVGSNPGSIGGADSSSGASGVAVEHRHRRRFAVFLSSKHCCSFEA